MTYSFLRHLCRSFSDGGRKNKLFRFDFSRDTCICRCYIHFVGVWSMHEFRKYGRYADIDRSPYFAFRDTFVITFFLSSSFVLADGEESHDRGVNSPRGLRPGVCVVFVNHLLPEPRVRHGTVRDLQTFLAEEFLRAGTRENDGDETVSRTRRVAIALQPKSSSWLSRCVYCGAHSCCCEPAWMT